uniref:Uncharacterized protein n=1 Tax=Trichogramma kaykai TaxID=54128 RepID=A0ABD2VVS3_9HYME
MSDAVFEVIFSLFQIVEYFGRNILMIITVLTLVTLGFTGCMAVRAHKSESRRKNRLYDRRSRASAPCPRICIIYKTQSSGGSSSSRCTDKKTMYICFCTAGVEGVRRCTGGPKTRRNFHRVSLQLSKHVLLDNEDAREERRKLFCRAFCCCCCYHRRRAGGLIKEEPSYTLSNSGEDYAFDSVSCETENLKTFLFQELSASSIIQIIFC